MTDAVAEFLKKIGPRKLTDDEARQLHILKLQQGTASNSGAAGILSAQVSGGYGGKESDKDE